MTTYGEEKVPLKAGEGAYPAQVQQTDHAGPPLPPYGEAYPQTTQPGHPYPPAGQPYPPAGQPYPPAGQPYPPVGQPYPGAGQPYPSAGQPYQPAGQPYQPAGQPYQPAGKPYHADLPYTQHGQPYTQPGHQVTPCYASPQGQQVTVTTVQRTEGGPMPCSYIASLVMASFVCLCGCWLIAIPAVVFAVMSLVVHQSDAKAAKTYFLIGLGLWVAAIVVTVVIIVIIFMAYVPMMVSLHKSTGDLDLTFTHLTHTWN